MRAIYMFILMVVPVSVFAQEGDQQAMMKQWMEAAAPDANHKLIAEMAGAWKVAGRYRMMPQAPWQATASTAVQKMILGGRFLQIKITGEMMGMPFHGFGMLGYDKALKKYVSIWGDNFGTMLMSGIGTGDLVKKTIETMSEFQDPMSGQMAKMRSVYIIKSDKKFVLEMYSYAPDGAEYLSMELIYTK